MARPNEGKTNKYIFVRISPKLYRLLIARKNILANDGQKFVKKASIADISNEFVDYFFKTFRLYSSVKKTKIEYDKTLIKNI
jgi:hypothetical protein